MIVYRIANPIYSHDISGEGAKINGARWNSKGVPMLYTSENISLATLEMLIHTNFTDYIISLDLLYISIPDTGFSEINISKLKNNWVEDFEYSKFIGDEFIKSNQSLVLKIPSAVVYEEHNYLVNPLHPEFRKVKIIKTKSFSPDKRLFYLK